MMEKHFVIFSFTYLFDTFPSRKLRLNLRKSGGFFSPARYTYVRKPLDPGPWTLMDQPSRRSVTRKSVKLDVTIVRLVTSVTTKAKIATQGNSDNDVMQETK